MKNGDAISVAAKRGMGFQLLDDISAPEKRI
jgi:hypothetical protein